MEEGIKVLYVDDEPGLLEIARLFLERTGNFRVSTATAAQDALESPSIRSYDAIISDYQMPGMDGIAFLKEVRHRYGDIPFILFTGRGREEVVIAAINNGADFYLQKGGDPTAQFAELAHKIRQAVARRRADRSRIKAELALRESEERLRLFIQHAPAALAMFDREMRYLAASRRWMADYHLGDRDIIGCSHYEIFPEITEKIKAVHRRGLSGEVVSADEGKFERQDGSVQYLAWEVRPWFAIGNTVGGIIIFSEDITQRKKAEKALQKSMERLHLAVDASSDGLFDWDMEKDTAYFSPRYFSMLGYAPGDLPASFSTWTGLLHPDDRDQAISVINEYRTGTRESHIVEFRLRAKDGSWRWILSRAKITGRNAQGKPLRMVGTHTDITDRKRAEEVLQENEKRLLMAQEIGKIGSWEYNLKTNRIWGSAEAARIYGLKPGEGDFPVGQVEACIPERGRVHQALVDLIGSNKEYNLEFAINPADGTAQKIIHSMARLERDASGNPLRITGVIQDITDRKRTEELLRESEEKYRTIFEESFDGLFITSPQGKILDMNRKGIAMFGYATKEEICSLDLERDVYTFPPDRKRILAMVDAQGTAEYEVVVKRKGGETMITYCSLTAVRDTDGTITSYRGIIRDITGKKRVEEAVRESEKRYRSIIELNRAGYFRIDRDGRFVDVNNAWLTMHKYSSKDEIIGKHFSITQVETDLGSAEQIVKAVLEGKTIPPGTFSRRCKDGSAGYHTFIVTPLEQEGRIVGLEGFLIDIPEHK